jgi:two-component sensor histidine kinase
MKALSFRLPRGGWNKKPFLHLGGFLALSLPLLMISCSSSPRPVAKDGVLDLRAWDFSAHPVLQLQGEWDFYPGILAGGRELQSLAPARTERMVPDLWKGREAGGERGQGAGSYRLVVLLPPGHPDLAIRYRTVSTAFELEAEGRLVAAVGRPALDPREAKAEYRPGVVALPRQGESSPGAGESLELVVRVSNHEYRSGGMWRSFSLGASEAQFRDKRLADITLDCQAAIILIISFNAFMLFVFRPKEKAYLFLSLFGVSIAFRVLVTGEYLIMNIFPGMSFDLLIRLEYLTVSLPIPLAAISFAELFPDEGKPTLTFLVCLPFALRIAFGLSLVPLPLLTRSIFIFYFLAAGAMLALLFGLFIPAIRHKRQGAVTCLVAVTILALSFVNDGLFASFLINTSNWLGFGLIAFMMIQSGVLTRRFSLAFDRGEALQEELAIANGMLAEENGRYRESQSRLVEALAEKDMLLREVHHRVKNSLQIVSSSLTLQAHRTADPAALEIYSSVRNRIRAISLVHEKLYCLESAEHMDLGGYLRDLVAQLTGGYDSRTGKVELELVTDRVEANVDVCVDFGLLVTELVANSYKHAILPQGGGRLGLGLRREVEGLTLRVEDDGPGFPAEFAPSTTQSLGFQVVSGLARKYKGRVVVMPGPGGIVEIRFPLSSIEFDPACHVAEDGDSKTKEPQS